MIYWQYKNDNSLQKNDIYLKNFAKIGNFYQKIMVK